MPGPAGGEVNESLSIFDYESHVVEYPGAMFDQIAAFYDAWFPSAGLQVEPEFIQKGFRRCHVTSLDLTVQLESFASGGYRLIISWL